MELFYHLMKIKIINTSFYCDNFVCTAAVMNNTITAVSQAYLDICVPAPESLSSHLQIWYTES